MGLAVLHLNRLAGNTGLRNEVLVARDGQVDYSSSRKCRSCLVSITNGWLALHESGTFVKFTKAGAAMFA